MKIGGRQLTEREVELLVQSALEGGLEIADTFDTMDIEACFLFNEGLISIDNTEEGKRGYISRKGCEKMEGQFFHNPEVTSGSLSCMMWAWKEEYIDVMIACREGKLDQYMYCIEDPTKDDAVFPYSKSQFYNALHLLIDLKFIEKYWVAYFLEDGRSEDRTNYRTTDLGRATVALFHKTTKYRVDEEYASYAYPYRDTMHEERRSPNLKRTCVWIVKAGEERATLYGVDKKRININKVYAKVSKLASYTDKFRKARYKYTIGSTDPVVGYTYTIKEAMEEVDHQFCIRHNIKPVDEAS